MRIFQVGEAAVVKLGDTDKGTDILGVLLEGCGNLGESFFIVALHGGNDFESLGEAVQALVNGAGFGGCVVGHTGMRHLLS